MTSSRSRSDPGSRWRSCTWGRPAASGRRVDVGADHAGRPGPASGQVDAPLIRSRDADLRPGFFSKASCSSLRKRFFLGVADERLEEGHHRRPWLEVGAHARATVSSSSTSVTVDGLHEVDPLGEVPVQGADPDAGLPAMASMEAPPPSWAKPRGRRRPGARSCAGRRPAWAARRRLVAAAHRRRRSPVSPSCSWSLPVTRPRTNWLAKRRHPPYTNRRKLPLIQNTSGKVVVNALHPSAPRLGAPARRRSRRGPLRTPSVPTLRCSSSSSWPPS